MSNEAKAAAMLGQSDLVLLRLIGMLIHILVHRGDVPKQAGAQMLQDAAAFLPDDHPLIEAIDLLTREFR